MMHLVLLAIVHGSIFSMNVNEAHERMKLALERSLTSFAKCAEECFKGHQKEKKNDFIAIHVLYGLYKFNQSAGKDNKFIEYKPIITRLCSEKFGHQTNTKFEFCSAVQNVLVQKLPIIDKSTSFIHEHIKLGLILLKKDPSIPAAAAYYALQNNESVFVGPVAEALQEIGFIGSNENTLFPGIAEILPQYKDKEEY